jgi:hypothetical protein
MTKRLKNVREDISLGRAKKFLGLSAEQWDSPAGFHAHEIKRVSLREVIDPNVPTKNIPELSIPELYDLAAARLSLAPDDYRVAIMGHGIINKQRALSEVGAHTALGKHIAILQIQMLQKLTRLAENEVLLGVQP